MAPQSKVKRLPRSRQMQLRQENMERLRLYAQLPPEQRPAPPVRDKVSDYAPAPLTFNLDIKRVL